MFVNIIMSSTLIILNFIIIGIKGKKYLNKYLFFPFFTVGFIAYALDINGIYKFIPNEKLDVLYINVFFYFMLLISMIFFDNISSCMRTKKTHKMNNIDTIIKITKLLVLINLVITFYCLYRLISMKGLSLFLLYTTQPYFLEVNFVPNGILGNILKLNLYNLILMVTIKLEGANYKNFKLFFLLSLFIMFAPNRKGDAILLGLAITHLILYYKKLDIKKIFKLFSVLLISIYGVFEFTYFFYKTAGVSINIFNKFYVYLTGPIAGTAYLKKINVTSFLEFKILNPILDKLNIIELYNIHFSSGDVFINGIGIGNVKGFFNPYYSDLGFWGAIIFALFLGLFINLLEATSNSIFSKALLVILISFLDMALFGNYFTNPLFISVLVTFIFYKICDKFIVMTKNTTGLKACFRLSTTI